MSYDDAEVMATRGNYRAVIVRDDYPDKPEFFAGDPILDDTGTVVYGGEEEKRDRAGKYVGLGLHWSVEAVRYAYEHKMVESRWAYPEWDVRTFERYVRIFHGGTVKWINDGQRGGSTYCALALPEYRKTWGSEDESVLHDEAHTEEWEAFIEGDVFAVVIQRLEDGACGHTDCDEHQSWVEVESVWGHYGEKYAGEAALEQLGYYAPEVAA